MKEQRPSGEPVLAEVGPPVILSLGIAGYCSVMRLGLRCGQMSRMRIIGSLVCLLLSVACQGGQRGPEAHTAAARSPVPSPSPLVVELGPPSPEATRLSLVSLLVEPKRFDGAIVRVGGFMHLEFEGNQLCLHRDDALHYLRQNCVWLSVPKQVFEPLNDRYVVLEGTVRADYRGHLGLWPAAIVDINGVAEAPRRTNVRNDGGPSAR